MQQNLQESPGTGNPVKQSFIGYWIMSPDFTIYADEIRHKASEQTGCISDKWFFTTKLTNSRVRAKGVPAQYRSLNISDIFSGTFPVPKLPMVRTHSSRSESVGTPLGSSGNFFVTSSLVISDLKESKLTDI